MNNSDSKNTNFEPEFTEVSGLGSVKVDGKTVYDTSDEFVKIGDDINDKLETKLASEDIRTFVSEAEAEIDAAVAKVEADIDAAVNKSVGAEGSAPTSDATWANAEGDAAAKAGDSTATSAGAPASASHYPNPSQSSKKPFSYVNKWGLWVGVILITLGTLIFLDMLSGFVPAMENIFGGHSVWRFWPLLIIFCGLVVAFSPAKSSPDPRRNDGFSLLRFCEGMFVMTLGLVLLGNSLGFVSWLTWPAMLSFWPLLLVIGGLSMLSYALKTEWFSLVAYIVSILVLISVASSMWVGDAALVEPFITLAEFGSFRGMDLFNIGSEFTRGF